MTSAQRWLLRRSHHHAEFSADRLRAQRTESVSIVVPTRECAATIGPVVDALCGLRAAGAVDQVLVVDAGSADGTAGLAAARGAEVVPESGLLPEHGPVLGKGDAMWRALSAATGDIVAFVDGDTAGFSERFACGIVGPLVCEPGVQFVKAAYRRPFTADGVVVPDGGGRVSQLSARPLLAMFYPELAAIRQPLSGEIAARRDLLEALPFATGYAVETAMLIDVYRRVGLDGIAQVDFDERRNRHQPLDALVPMAYSVLQVVADRLEREGRLTGVDAGHLLVVADDGMEPHPVDLIERPPLASLGLGRVPAAPVPAPAAR
jgi:glucosyl-3-phosphoglycerate synthase